MLSAILQRMKVSVVTCYKHTNYVRGVTLREAIERVPDVNLCIITNSHTNFLRYPEVLGKILWNRLSVHPDTYLLTFRAYEILPLTIALIGRKKLIYDEFINPLEWLNEERKEWWTTLIPKKLLFRFYRLLLKRCQVVLTDTSAHASHSARMMRLPKSKFASIAVGADESLFYPKNITPSTNFSVFYYGSMLPLHGLDVVIKAAMLLSGEDIEFTLAGGDTRTLEMITIAKQAGANITHHTWLPYDQLTDYAQQAHLVLGGPFGNTPQANMVVTGKTYQFLASRTPVLIGQTIASNQFVDGQNCLSVPLGDAPALADKILWATKHPRQLETIASEGYELYKQNFSYPALAIQMETILKRLA